MLKLEWAYKVLKFGETKEPKELDQAEIMESALEIELNQGKSAVTFKFVDQNNQTVSITNANIPNLDPTNIRLLCYFKARNEAKQAPIDKENMDEA